MKNKTKVFCFATSLFIFNIASAVPYVKELACIGDLEKFPIRSGDIDAFNTKYDECKRDFDKIYMQLPISASNDDFNLIDQYRLRLGVIDKNIRQDVVLANYNKLEQERIAKIEAEKREIIESKKKKDLAYRLYVEKWRKELKPGVNFGTPGRDLDLGLIIDVNYKTGLAKIEYQYCASHGTSVSGGMAYRLVNGAIGYIPSTSTTYCASWATGEKHVHISVLNPYNGDVPKEFRASWMAD